LFTTGNSSMLSDVVKKSASLLLIVMILAASGFSLCGGAHAQEHAWGGESRESSAAASVAADHCPGCPDGGHAGADHDASSCYCSCHLPLTEQFVRIQHDPVIAELVSFEPFSVLPEVYLPRFIPPQNLV
jgi:hypothetical protein